MKPKSQTLFHFTKNLELVKKILTEGFWPRYCLEDLTWYMQSNFYTAFPMVCFCDIPLSRIKDHVDFYGSYGIGVTKEWALLSRLNPVSYLSNTSNYGFSVTNMYKNFDHTAKTVYYEKFGADLNVILSHFKPLNGTMNIGGNFISKDFYQENEWRYVPYSEDIQQWLSKEIFFDVSQLEVYNLKIKDRFSLKLTPKDIRYIFVKQDADIPEIINFIQSNLDNYSNAELKILMSRVTSLQSITDDL
ncbi:abortive infection system antitoxin AbiGi family protein [Rheinheimera soli]|uniref:Abortive phage resistance protein AbiGi, antitoxin n=1 Tax=Rheinheimera soli TaxID=443616 RepID=A0ABU1W2G8_9GAMM|nr:abortive infection system antitoxin AbiGi family protein [Rheinheimera soli]MDR7122164.1 hypothetical protein [Rheinheimera soli]